MAQKPFEQMVTEYGPVVLRVCRAVLGPLEAEDAWSETFLAALRAYPSLRPGSDVEAWLVTIAHRKAIDQIRARSRAPVPLDALPYEPAGDGAPDGRDLDLQAALDALPDKQRMAVAWHYLAGMPYAEVGELIGNSEVAARRAASDGIRRLRETYGKETPR